MKYKKQTMVTVQKGLVEDDEGCRATQKLNLIRSRHAWTKKNPSSGDLITDFHDSYVNESRPLPSLQPVAAYNNAYYAYNVNNNTGNGLKFHHKNAPVSIHYFLL